MNNLAELRQEMVDMTCQAQLHLIESLRVVEYDKSTIEIATAISNSIRYRSVDPEDVEAAILNIAITCIKHLKPELLGR